jgi:hypothetical protein
MMTSFPGYLLASIWRWTCSIADAGRLSFTKAASPSPLLRGLDMPRRAALRLRAAPAGLPQRAGGGAKRAFVLPIRLQRSDN